MNSILGSILLGAALLGTVAAYASGALARWIERPESILIAVALFTAVSMVVRAVRSAKASRRLQELTMQVETANIKLTQLDKLKSEFLSFASHQIKAPMTVIKGYATLIIDGSFGPVSKEVGDVAVKIKDSADRMIGLVNTFLDLRKLDEGRMAYQFEETDLGALVASLVDEMQELARKKKLSLTLRPLPKQWRVRVDIQHFRQILQNLVDNAIKYTDKGSVAVAVGDGPNRTVEISVTDTGRGISPQLLPKLFEQFSRDQSVAKEIAGTGLGLYIAKQMVEAHKGTITVTSAGTDKGTTFLVRIPAL
jgi:signal transduction histidine kinase